MVQALHLEGHWGADLVYIELPLLSSAPSSHASPLPHPAIHDCSSRVSLTLFLYRNHNRIRNCDLTITLTAREERKVTKDGTNRYFVLVHLADPNPITQNRPLPCPALTPPIHITVSIRLSRFLSITRILSLNLSVRLIQP